MGGKGRRLTEEVDDGNEDGIGDGEDQEGGPTDGSRHRRQHLDDQEVEAKRKSNTHQHLFTRVLELDRQNRRINSHPVTHRRNRVGLRPHPQRVQLSGVQPGQRQPSRAEPHDVEEETERGALGGTWGSGDEACENDHHGGELTPGTGEEHSTTAETFDGEESGEGGESVDDGEDTAEDEGKTGLEADSVFEQNGSIY